MKKLLSNIGIRVSLITILINFLLFVFKLVAGLVSHSNAMVSDAIHSLSDVITTIAVIFGLLISSQKPDKNHPYGHERIESAFSIVLSFLLLLTGLGIGYRGLSLIMAGSDKTPIPGILAMVASLVSILVKEAMFHYTMHTAKKINSHAMMSDAWHHRSDALSSIGAFLGILMSRLSLPIFDPLCSILISLLIVKVSIEIFISSIKELIDTSCDDETSKNFVDSIMEINNDIIVNDLKTRCFGSKLYIDVEIALDGNKTLNDTNKIVESIHDKIESKYPLVKHINIHTVPKKE